METMNKDMVAYCGAYCGICNWKEKMNCSGCHACASNMFWGSCAIAKCCIYKGYEHCGLCPDMPCERLLELFNDEEHGDNGARQINLKNWADGIYTYHKLDNTSQKAAKE